MKFAYIYIYIYTCSLYIYTSTIYIYSSDIYVPYIHTLMAVVSVSSVTTSSISCSVRPPTPPLNCMCSEVTFQVSQTTTDFATELAQPISFDFSDIIGCKIDFAHLRRWHNFPHMSLLGWSLCAAGAGPRSPLRIRRL